MGGGGQKKGIDPLLATQGVGPGGGSELFTFCMFSGINEIICM